MTDMKPTKDKALGELFRMRSQVQDLLSFEQSLGNVEKAAEHEKMLAQIERDIEIVSASTDQS